MSVSTSNTSKAVTETETETETEKLPFYNITRKEKQILRHLYDVDGDNELDANEWDCILKQYKGYTQSDKKKEHMFSSKLSLVKQILDKYEVPKDGEEVLKVLNREEKTRSDGSFSVALLERTVAGLFKDKKKTKEHLSTSTSTPTPTSTELESEIEESYDLPQELRYSSAFARATKYLIITSKKAARYLAFASDFGEAVRPVVANTVVTLTYVVSFSYVFVDVALEALKWKKTEDLRLKNGGKIDADTKKPGLETVTIQGSSGSSSLTLPSSSPSQVPVAHSPYRPTCIEQVIVERGTFQLIASLGLPYVIIHSTVNITHGIFKKFKSPRLNRWGPSLCGLAMIPIFPLYLDEPLEHLVEKGFRDYGPWASSGASNSSVKKKLD